MENETNQNLGNQLPTKKKSKLGLILIVILLLATIGFGVWYFVFNQKDEKDNDNKTTTTVNKDIVWEDKEIYNLSKTSYQENDIKVYRSKDDASLLGIFVNDKLSTTYKCDTNECKIASGQDIGGSHGNAIFIKDNNYNNTIIVNMETGKYIKGTMAKPILFCQYGESAETCLIKIKDESIFAMEDSNGKYGIVNENAEILVNFEYDDIYNVKNILAYMFSEKIGDKYYTTGQKNSKYSLISIYENKTYGSYDYIELFSTNYVNSTNYAIYNNGMNMNILDVSTNKKLFDKDIPIYYTDKLVSAQGSVSRPGEIINAENYSVWFKKDDLNTINIRVYYDIDRTECIYKAHVYEYNITTKKLTQVEDVITDGEYC